MSFYILIQSVYNEMNVLLFALFSLSQLMIMELW